MRPCRCGTRHAGSGHYGIGHIDPAIPVHIGLPGVLDGDAVGREHADERCAEHASSRRGEDTG